MLWNGHRDHGRGGAGLHGRLLPGNRDHRRGGAGLHGRVSCGSPCAFLGHSMPTSAIAVLLVPPQQLSSSCPHSVGGCMQPSSSSSTLVGTSSTLRRGRGCLTGRGRRPRWDEDEIGRKDFSLSQQVRNSAFPNTAAAWVQCTSENSKGDACLPKESTYFEAESVCFKQNMRLCFVREILGNTCCGSGCGFDTSRVWATQEPKKFDSR